MPIQKLNKDKPRINRVVLPKIRCTIPKSITEHPDYLEWCIYLSVGNIWLHSRMMCYGPQVGATNHPSKEESDLAIFYAIAMLENCMDAIYPQ